MLEIHLDEADLENLENLGKRPVGLSYKEKELLNSIKQLQLTDDGREDLLAILNKPFIDTKIKQKCKLNMMIFNQPFINAQDVAEAKEH